MSQAWSAQANAAETTATGHIVTTKYQPELYDDGATKLNRIHVVETFNGDLVGEGTVEFLQAYGPDGKASFVGLERFKGKLNGKEGTFVLQDHGTLVGDRVSGKWVVVPGSATGALVGLYGEGGFEAKVGESASITLTYGFK